MSRVLAAVAAIAMVAAAFTIRSQLDDGGQQASSARAATVCVTELAEVCRAVLGDDADLTIAPGWETFDELLAAPDAEAAGVDAWLAPEPMLTGLAEARATAGLSPMFTDTTSPLARSPLVLVVWSERAPALAEACGGEISWTCLGDEADAPWADLGGQASWGRLKPGHDDPTTSAVGLLVAAQATGDRLDRSDWATNDFEVPGFRSWFESLESTVDDLAPPTGTPLDRLLAVGPAAYDVVGTTEADAARVERSRDRDRLDTLYPSPMATVDVALASTDAGGAVADRFVADSGSAFEAADWRVGPSEPPLPDTSGTAAPGALVALRALAQEVQ